MLIPTMQQSWNYDTEITPGVGFPPVALASSNWWPRGGNLDPTRHRGYHQGWAQRTARVPVNEAMGYHGVSPNLPNSSLEPFLTNRSQR